MATIRVYYEVTSTYTADIDYDKLVRLAGEDGPQVPPLERLTGYGTSYGPQRPGEALAEYLDDYGSEIDSSGAMVTDYARIGG